MNEDMNLENKPVDNDPLKIDAALSDWEEMMVEELSSKYNLSDDVVLNIGLTFVINEMSAAMNGKPAIINSISPCAEKTETTVES